MPSSNVFLDTGSWTLALRASLQDTFIHVRKSSEVPTKGEWPVDYSFRIYLDTRGLEVILIVRIDYAVGGLGQTYWFAEKTTDYLKGVMRSIPAHRVLQLEDDAKVEFSLANDCDVVLRITSSDHVVGELTAVNLQLDFKPKEPERA